MLPRLGRLAYRTFIRGKDIRPLLNPTTELSPTFNSQLTYVNMPLPRNWLSGCITSIEDTDDINITVGQARSTGDGGNILVTTTISKQMDATWAAGDDAGGMEDGDTVGNNEWFHVFLLGKTTNDAYDAGFDTNLAAVNLLADTAVTSAGFTLYRRIASVLTDGSANPLAYTQFGDEFMHTVTVGDAETGTSSGLKTIAGVPAGIATLINTHWGVDQSSGDTLLTAHSPSLTAQTASATAVPGAIAQADSGGNDEGGGTALIRTDTSARVNVRVTGVNMSYGMGVLSWFDTRGKDGA